MSREYGRVHCAFWNNPDVRSGSDDARLLQLYLLTSPHSNMLGCYLCPPNYIADDLQWSTERVRETLSKLFDQRFAERFRDGRFIVIINFLKWNPIENPNIAMAALRLADQLPWTDPAFRHVFKGMELNQKRFGAEWQTVAERYAKACRNMEQEQEIEQEPEREQEQDSSLPLKLTEQPGSSKAKADPFEEWWDLVPKKVAKQDARKEFERIIRNKTATIEQLTTGMVAYAAACANKDPKFIRHPHRWLKGGCWTDAHAPDSNLNSGRNSGARQSAIDYVMETYGQRRRDD